jgi:hypothetical protein
MPGGWLEALQFPFQLQRGQLEASGRGLQVIVEDAFVQAGELAAKGCQGALPLALGPGIFRGIRRG